MTRKMIINAMDPDEVRIAILNNGVLEEFDIEARGSEKNKGNIYKSIVMAAEPALNAAFVNYGAEKQGFLTAHDVDPKHAGLAGDKQHAIDELLKPKQTLLVQISKDEVGTKGAVLTTFLSLAGRYVVLMPDSQRQGISRKIEDEDTRKRMREAASMLDVPEGMGVIIRTAGRDRSRIELNRDLKVLLRLWENIQKEAETAKAPALIFKEQDVIIRALRDYFSNDIDEIVLDSDEAFDRAAEYMHMVMPKHTSVLTRYVERRPIFHHYRVEDQLEALYSAKVALPSGGSIVIQPTEAMVSVDVNSGKQKSSHHEDTATKTNMEAAEEIARQLRLRDLGGIVVIDFIDMSQRKNQQKVERVLKEALKVDKARVKVGHISTNGTLELTRQRIRTALQSTMFEMCSVCRGTGHILSTNSHVVHILRRLRDRCARGDLLVAKVRMDIKTANLLKTEKWPEIEALQTRNAVRIEIISDAGLHPGEDDFTFETNPDAQIIPIEEPNFGPAPRYESETGNDDTEPEEEEVEEMSEEYSQAKQSRSQSNDLDLPHFEMVDPRSLGLRKRSEGRHQEQRHHHENRRHQHHHQNNKRPQRDYRSDRSQQYHHDQHKKPAKAGFWAFLARLFGFQA